MDRRLAKHAFVPKGREDQLTELPVGTEVLGVGYAGGSALHLLLEVPEGAITKSVERQPRSFRRFGLGDIVPSEYRYVGHAIVGPEWVFIYERMKA